MEKLEPAEQPEGSFDGWVRGRLHLDSSDLPDLATHIDPSCFEAGFELPAGGVDDLFSWLNQDDTAAMDTAPDAAAAGDSVLGEAPAPSPAAAGHDSLAAATAVGIAPPPPGHAYAHQQQQHISGWQLAFLQQAVQQPQQQWYAPVALGAGSAAAPAAPGMLSLPGVPDCQPPQQQQQHAWQAHHLQLQQQQQWFPQPGDPAAAAAAAATAARDLSSSPGAAADTAANGQSDGSKKQPQQRCSSTKGGSKQTAAAGGGATKQKKPRRVTDAQRAAHKRFRVRRKEQLSSMAAEVAAKQAQLQELEAEQQVLAAKARALEQLVATAGDSVMLLQRLETLSLEPNHQQQQQQQSQQRLAGSSRRDNNNNIGSLVALGSAVGAPAAPAQHDTALPAVDTSAAAAAGEALHAVFGSSNSAALTRAPSSSSVSEAASIQRLEAAVRAALGRPLLQPPPQQQQQQQQLELLAPPQAGTGAAAAAGQALPLQGTLPALQQLLKTLLNEVMQLVLQLNRDSSAQHAAAGAGSSGSYLTAAAAARLDHIRHQVYEEFRAFAATNRINMLVLTSLNLETGLLVRPPAGHWVSSAQLLLQRLDPQTLQDIALTYRLFMGALAKITRQRHMLLTQLHAELRDTTSASSRSSYSNDSLYATASTPDLLGPRCRSVLLLNAIDSNLRREYVLEGVFSWSLKQLLPPMVTSELAVTSYPYLTDGAAIVAELLRLLPPQLAAAQAPQHQHEQQQQQQLEHQELMQQVLVAAEQKEQAPSLLQQQQLLQLQALLPDQHAYAQTGLPAFLSAPCS